MDTETIRVLLVEDSADDAFLLRRQLEHSKLAIFAIQHVLTLASALERTAAEQFDAVLLDLKLPDSSGLETFRNLRRAAADLPIVVMTGLEDEHSGVTAVQGGAGGYLIKGQTDAKLLVRSLLYAIQWHRARKAEARLRQAEKLEAVGLLAQGVAHHFYNALMVILGNSQLLEGELPDGRAKELARAIARSGERAAAVTRGLIAFARPTTGKAAQSQSGRRSVDIDLVVDVVLRLTRPIIGGRIAVVTTRAGPGVAVHANPADLEQIVLNLVMNARDAMPDGGALTIAASRGDPAPTDHAALRHAAQGPWVKLSVTDTGRGIDQETQRHLFEPFFTTKKVGQGLGLGLAAVYGLVKECGGTIRVTSELGKGSVFEILLPASNAADDSLEACGSDAIAGGSSADNTSLDAMDGPGEVREHPGARRQLRRC